MDKWKNRRNSPIKIFMFSIISVIILLVGLLFVGELLCRIKLSLSHKDTYYLFAPFKSLKEATVEYKLDIKHYNLDNPKGENTYYYKMEPGLHLPPNIYDYGYFMINSFGFRGKEFDPANKKGKARIFCIGESSTFGVESPDDQTWPARLEYYLNQDTKNGYEVINAGFTGAASATYRNLIRFELIKYHPDIFIIYGGANEMILDRNIQKKKISKFTGYMHKNLYYKWSILYTLMLEKISSLVRRSPAPMNLYSSNPNAVFTDNIEWIINLCKENNVKLIFVRQMYYSNMDLFIRDDISLEEIRKVLGQEKGWLTSQKIYEFNSLMRSLTLLATKYNIPLIDVREEFYNSLKRNEKLYYDWIHLTSRGNDLLARLISRELHLLL